MAPLPLSKERDIFSADPWLTLKRVLLDSGEAKVDMVVWEAI